MSNRKQQRYAAKLLFQFRVGARGWSKRRFCEERIIHLRARSAHAALTAANRIGREAVFKYRNSDGRIVHFEFIGVLDLLRLGPECGPNEVWYDIKEMISPMERRTSLIPPDSMLISRAG